MRVGPNWETWQPGIERVSDMHVSKAERYQGSHAVSITS